MKVIVIEALTFVNAQRLVHSKQIAKSDKDMKEGTPNDVHLPEKTVNSLLPLLLSQLLPSYPTEAPVHKPAKQPNILVSPVSIFEDLEEE